MANDRYRTDEQLMGPERGRDSESDERIRNGIGEEVRGVADDEEDEDFEDMEDIEDDDDSDGSF